MSWVYWGADVELDSLLTSGQQGDEWSVSQCGGHLRD